jgi:catechol 2,3-dioxygenase-like lactoylglutathione lyase family enzyme
MLKDSEAVATIGVKKIDNARKFYEGVLGLKLMPGGNEHEEVARL